MQSHNILWKQNCIFCVLGVWFIRCSYVKKRQTANQRESQPIAFRILRSVTLGLSPRVPVAVANAQRNAWLALPALAVWYYNTAKYCSILSLRAPDARVKHLVERWRLATNPTNGRMRARVTRCEWLRFALIGGRFFPTSKAGKTSL